MKGYRYTPQIGDVVYAIPGAGAWGAVFSRGADPSGARCPVRAVMRGSRVFPLYDAALYGIANVKFATETPMTTRNGFSELDFCNFVGRAFKTYEAVSGVGAGSPPTSLAAGARVWGWTLVS